MMPMQVVDSEPSSTRALSTTVFDNAPMPWQVALDTWARTKLQSERTREEYTKSVSRAFATPGMPGTLDALTIHHLDAYGGGLRSLAEVGAPPERRLAPSSVNAYLAALRSFLAFCRLRGWTPPALARESVADALADVKVVVKKPYEVVNADERERMLAAARAYGYEAERATAFVALLYGAGLRRAEACALEVGDIHVNGGERGDQAYVDVRDGKGRKQRQVPISASVLRELVRYLDATGRALHRRADRETPLFLRRAWEGDRARWHPEQARKCVAKVAARAGLPEAGKHITPHALRHSYAIDLLRAGAPVPVVSKLLGHSSIAVTGRYLDHFALEEMARYAPSIGTGAATDGGR